MTAFGQHSMVPPFYVNRASVAPRARTARTAREAPSMAPSDNLRQGKIRGGMRSMAAGTGGLFLEHQRKRLLDIEKAVIGKLLVVSQWLGPQPPYCGHAVVRQVPAVAKRLEGSRGRLKAGGTAVKMSK